MYDHQLTVTQPKMASETFQSRCQAPSCMAKLLMLPRFMSLDSAGFVVCDKGRG